MAFMVLGLVAVVGCGGSETQSEAQSETQSAGGTTVDAKISQALQNANQSGQDHATPSGGTTLAGVSFVPPAGWKDVGASGMRQAQYRLAPVSGDSAEGEVNVFYFGANSGGGVQANLDRWVGQITLPDGADPASAIERGSFTADGMAGHIVSLNGTYKSGGGRPMGGEGVMLPGYRLVGVVVEGPQGSLFFKLTGPEATARAMESDLLTMVKGATK